MEGQLMMLRKTMIALLATAAVSMLVPGVAAARGGHGGGGFGGGGWHGGGGGWHGGGMAWHGSGGGMAWHGARVAGGHFHHGFRHHRVFFVGAGPYAYYDDYPSDYDDSYYAGDSGCYIVRQRVHTRHHGWRLRSVQVCG
jgi:hypothetical protein